MNETGGPVAKLLAYYQLDPDRLVAIHDELDIDPGQIRVKFGGGDNGHNGLQSIRALARRAGDFYRVRVGVGRPPGRQDPADFLLSNFPASAREAVAVEVDRAADAVESLVTVGLERTQNALQLLSRSPVTVAGSGSRLAARKPATTVARGRGSAEYLVSVTLSGLVDLFCTEPTLSASHRRRARGASRRRSTSPRRPRCAR